MRANKCDISPPIAHFFGKENWEHTLSKKRCIDIPIDRKNMNTSHRECLVCEFSLPRPEPPP